MLTGLEKLEDSGHGSAGMAWLEEGRMHCVRAVGVDAPDSALQAVSDGLSAGKPALAVAAPPSVGIGHTRWTARGAVSGCNGDSHDNAAGRIRIVFDGVIENHIPVHERIVGEAIKRSYETDAKAVAHLIALNYEGDLAEAVRCSLPDLLGRYAFVAMCEEEPETLVGVRRECPLVLGVGEDEQFVASSAAAFVDYARELSVPADDEIAVLRRGEG